MNLGTSRAAHVAAVKTRTEPPVSSEARLYPQPVDALPVTVFDNFWATTLLFSASLGRQGVPLHFYGNGAGRWSRYRVRHARCPEVTDAERFIPWLQQRVRSGEIARVAPTTDLIAYYVSLLREDFSPEVRRTIAPLAEIENCLIKTRFAAACEKIGQATPPTAAPEDPDAAVEAAERIGFPIILKPKSHLVVGSAERGCYVRDARMLCERFQRYPIEPGQELIAACYPELRWPLLQKYIPSARTRVFSVSGFKDSDGGIVAASVSCKQRQWPPDIGVSTSQVSCNDQQILNAGLRSVDRLVSRGLFELELLESGRQLLAIDLNPRAFGFLALDMALGNDLPWLWFQSTLRPLPPASLTQIHPVVEARLAIPHAIGQAVAWLCRGAEGEERVRPVKRVPMLGSWHDPLPLVVGNLRLLRHPGSLVRPYLRAALNARENNSNR